MDTIYTTLSGESLSDVQAQLLEAAYSEPLDEPEWGWQDEETRIVQAPVQTFAVSDAHGIGVDLTHLAAVARESGEFIPVLRNGRAVLRDDEYTGYSLLALAKIPRNGQWIGVFVAAPFATIEEINRGRGDR